MISVLVPYRPDHGHRDQAWAFNQARWQLMDDVELIVEAPAAGATPGEFNHPAAINSAAARATSDVLLVADADTTFDPAWVREAAAAVRGGAPWALPRFYDKLTEESTAAVLAGAPAEPITAYDVEWRGDSVSWSGLVVVARDTFDTVGGYDERFAYWGADDVCFALSAITLCGHALRLDGAAMHLWHPQPNSDTYGHARHPEQDALMRRYVAAAEDPAAIRAVRAG